MSREGSCCACVRISSSFCIFYWGIERNSFLLHTSSNPMRSMPPKPMLSGSSSMDFGIGSSAIPLPFIVELTPAWIGVWGFRKASGWILSCCVFDIWGFSSWDRPISLGGSFSFSLGWARASKLLFFFGDFLLWLTLDLLFLLSLLATFVNPSVARSFDSFLATAFLFRGRSLNRWPCWWHL